METNTSPDSLRALFDGIDNRGYDIVGLKLFRQGYRMFEDLAPGRVVEAFTGLPPPDDLLVPIAKSISDSWNTIKTQKVLTGIAPPIPNLSKYVPKF